MSATNKLDELEALIARLDELEQQVQEIRTAIADSCLPRWKRLAQSPREEETEADRQARRWVEEYMRKQREKDLKRINAAADRLEAKEKAAARNRKSPKSNGRTRRAG